MCCVYWVVVCIVHAGWWQMGPGAVFVFVCVIVFAFVFVIVILCLCHCLSVGNVETCGVNVRWWCACWLVTDGSQRWQGAAASRKTRCHIWGNTFIRQKMLISQAQQQPPSLSDIFKTRGPTDTGRLCSAKKKSKNVLLITSILTVH